MTKEEADIWMDQNCHKPPEGMNRAEKSKWEDGYLKGWNDGIHLVEELVKNNFEMTLSKGEEK